MSCSRLRFKRWHGSLGTEIVLSLFSSRWMKWRVASLSWLSLGIHFVGVRNALGTEGMAGACGVSEESDGESRSGSSGGLWK